MIALLRSTDGNPDSRFEKYTNFLKCKGINYKALCWDRYNNKIDDKNNIYFHLASGYGKGFANVINLLKFNLFLLKKLLLYRKEYKVIHAADFDTIIPAIIMRLLCGKKVIYDIYDWYIDSRSIKNKLIKFLFLIIEFINIKISNVVIICEQERLKQIRYKPHKLWVLPNIPNYKEVLDAKKAYDNLTISYVGILGYERGLEKLIKYAKDNSNLVLKIAGFGPLTSLLEDVNKYKNITFYGSVAYTEALKIMNSSDIIYAVYETSNPNHIMAAPNKYYEGLYLGKPIITTKNTIVGKKTEKYKTGFVIGESYEELEKLLSNIDFKQVAEYAHNAECLWKKQYSNYVDTFLNDKYLKYICS